ncbi:MAG: metal-dependent hydrolase [Xenococcaceae cyanobacterium]
MTGLSHAVLAIAGTSIVLGTSNPFLLGISAIASLLPDIDTSRSTAGKLMPEISKWIENRYAHRTITHSWIAVIVVAVIALPMYFVWTSAYWSILIGFCLGIAGDCLTVSGVKFFYPLPDRVVIIDNYQMRFKTGSRSEFIVMLALAAVAAVSIYINSGGGGMGAITQAFGKTEGAIDFFNRNAGEHIILADVKGWRGSDRKPIHGEFRIIKVKEFGFIFQDMQGYLYEASENRDTHIIINRIKTRKGAAIARDTKVIQLRDEPILKRLRELSAHEIYISGTLEVEYADELAFPKSADILWPVELTEKGINLEMASPEQLASLGDRYGSGTLTVNLIRGK